MRLIFLLLFILLMPTLVHAQYVTPNVPSGLSRMEFTDGFSPNISYTGNEITQIVSDTTGTNYEANTVAWLGIVSGGAEHRLLWKCDLSWLPSASQIVIYDAELRFTTKNEHVSYVDADAVLIGAHRLFKDMSIAQATWTNYATASAWGTAGANDISGTWDNLFGGVGTYTITSQMNNIYNNAWTDRDGIGVFTGQSWDNMPIGTDSLTVASISGGMDRCEFAESYDNVKPYATSAATTFEWQFRINVRKLVTLWHTMGLENYGALLRVEPTWIINPSGNGGLIGVHTQNHTTVRYRPTLVVWFYYIDAVTVPDGGGAGGGGMGNPFQGVK